MRSTRNGPATRRTVERILAAGLAYAEQHTARQLDRHLKRLLAEIDPATVVTRRRRALAERGVWIQHRGDGTADLSARLDSTDAEQVYAAIRAVALAAQRVDSRTADAPVRGARSTPWTRADALGCGAPVDSRPGRPSLQGRCRPFDLDGRALVACSGRRRARATGAAGRDPGGDPPTGSWSRPRST